MSIMQQPSPACAFSLRELDATRLGARALRPHKRQRRGHKKIVKMRDLQDRVGSTTIDAPAGLQVNASVAHMAEKLSKTTAK
jgi:hypothetical protein